MNGYQKLKRDLESQIMATKEARWMCEVCKEALWKIAQMKGPQVTEAPGTALEALAKLFPNEKK